MPSCQLFACSALLPVHVASSRLQTDNCAHVELHTLVLPPQIMESLGGDQLWFDRFLAEHSALLYYWVLIFMYLLSPKNAYAFSELVEWHATDTYTQVSQDTLMGGGVPSHPPTPLSPTYTPPSPLPLKTPFHPYPPLPGVSMRVTDIYTQLSHATWMLTCSDVCQDDGAAFAGWGGLSSKVCASSLPALCC
jgi:ubiquinol oxidase